MGTDIQSEESAEQTSSLKELSQINKNLELLIEKTDSSKKRDRWDRLQILSSFVSSVLFAGVGLYFTTVYNKREADRQEKLQSSQIAMSEREEKRETEAKALQLKIASLNAVTSMTPALASKDKDVKALALVILRVLSDSGYGPLINFDSINAPISQSKNRTEANSLPRHKDLIEKFAESVLAVNGSFSEKIKGLNNLGTIATDSSSSVKIKRKAENYISKIANSKEVPNKVREIANKYLEDIKNASELILSNNKSNYTSFYKRYFDGICPINDLLTAHQSLVNTQIELCKNSNQKMDIYKYALVEAQKIENNVKKYYDDGRVANTDLLLAQNYRLKYEIEVKKTLSLSK